MVIFKKYSPIWRTHIWLVILGTYHAGVACTELNKILACLDIHNVSPTLLRKYEQEVGSAIEKAAKRSCISAAEEERKLVIGKMEELCTELLIVLQFWLLF